MIPGPGTQNPTLTPWGPCGVGPASCRCLNDLVNVPKVHILRRRADFKEGMSESPGIWIQRPLFHDDCLEK